MCVDKRLPGLVNNHSQDLASLTSPLCLPGHSLTLYNQRLLCSGCQSPVYSKSFPAPWLSKLKNDSNSTRGTYCRERIRACSGLEGSGSSQTAWV